MKYISSIFAVAALLFAAASCGKEVEEQEVEGTLVAASVISPEDNISINLGAVSEPLRIEWTAASWDGIGYPTYKVVFVKDSGELSHPDAIYFVSHIDSTVLSLDKAALNDIFAKTAASETATSVGIAWAVVSMAGKNSGMSDPRSLRLTLPVLTAAVPLTPAAGATIDIDTFESDMTFTWTAASWDGLGTPENEILFAAAESDFARPAFVKAAESTSGTITQEEIKTIFERTCVNYTDPEAAAKWCVRTTIDGKTVLSEARNVTIHKTPEKKFIPGMTLSIGGEAAIETKKALVYMPNTTYSWDKAISAHYNDNAPYCKEFDYEIFTQLEGGKSFYIHCDEDWYLNLNTATGYAANANAFELVEAADADLEVTVETSGIYRIRLNTETKEFYMKKINQMNLRHWSGGAKNPVMNYDGNGKWSLDIALPSNCLGYKFLPLGLDADQPHGAQFPAAATPTGAISSYDPVNDNYWHIVPVQGGAANATPKSNGTFVVPDPCKGVTLRYVLNLNDVNGTYSHSIEAIQ